MFDKTTITNLWSSFNKLPTWKKVLLFLPLIILIAIIAVLVFMGGKNSNQEMVVKHNKKQVDKQIENFEDLSKIEEAKRAKNQTKIKAIESKINENHKELEKTINAIDNADGDADELLRIAEELRGRHKDIN